MKRFTFKAAFGAAALVLATAGVASAHVTVNPNSVPGGSYTKLTFRVPTESDKLSTTKVQIFFPASAPLAFVSVKPHAGWTFTETKGKPSIPVTSDDGPVTEVVTGITWTATSAAAAIKPGEFDEFDVSVGPLPATGDLQFKALQTYSDGSIVRWIDNGESAEHPAPTLTLTAATGDAHGMTPAPASSGNGTAKTALGLSIGALVVALGGLGLGLRRKKA